MSSSPSAMMSVLDQVKLLDKLEAIQIQGHDRRGCQVLTVVGKLFPGAGVVSSEGLNKYLEEKIFPRLGEKAWSVVYIHTGVQRGVWALKSIYDAIPLHIKQNLQALYFLHPGLHARLFFATLGRFLFSAGLYWKLKYVNRVEFLWEHVRRKEMKIPEFVHDHDDQLEYRPMMVAGLEIDDPPHYASLFMENSLTHYSARCSTV